MAGLAHSIYETITEYQFVGLSLKYRETVANIIGDNAEKLAYLFYLGEYNDSLKDNLRHLDELYVIDDVSNIRHKIENEQFKQLMEISCANIIEQIDFALENNLATPEDIMPHLRPYTNATLFLSKQANLAVGDYQTKFCSTRNEK